MCRALREHVREAAEYGVDWREVVTSIRHDTTALWQRLDEAERQRFLRHVRPYWETHRHRSAPETDRTICAMRANGNLDVIAGHLTDVREAPEALEVTIRRRGATGVERLRIGKLVNCTGPNTDLRTVADPFMQHLVREGQVRPDRLGLGLDSDATGAIIDAAGRASDWLSLVGPLRKGALWEHTAVPELRGEAKRMAERFARESKVESRK